VFDEMFVPTLRGKRLLDICSGFGMLASVAVRHGHSVTLVERDHELLSDSKFIFEDAIAGDAMHICEDFKNYQPGFSFDVVVANPPFSGNSAVEFLECLPRWLAPHGSAFLILPAGFIIKSRPARIPAALEKFTLLSEIRLPEGFAHTKVNCDLVHLKYNP
jgi:16S rRNA G1207 methylase RsmC